MKNILFVDDDPNVLSGLRRMMRPMKNEWHMHFVENGEDALKLLGDHSIDVIVSDMRMPIMNGADLLRTAMQEYPNTIRIAFSGQSEPELTLDISASAHQYLSKPCDAEQVKYTINRACNLRHILANDDLQRLVAGLGTLPGLPEMYLKIVKIFESPDASLRDIGETISHDIAMSAKILQLVNSSFFSIRQHVATPAEAVALLGFEVVKGLVLSTKVFGGSNPIPRSILNLPSLSQYSNECAVLARQIAESEISDVKTKDYAFIAGMLHTVGRLVLAANLPHEYAKVVAKEDNEHDVWELEKDIFGQSHMDIGAYLLGLWGLADPIVEAVAYYRSPLLSTKTEFTPLTAVHAASGLLLGEHLADNNRGYLDWDYLTTVGVADRIEHWSSILQEMRSAGEAI